MAFLQGIIDWRKEGAVEFKAWMKRRRDFYRDIARTRFAPDVRDLARLHEKFATIYAAGALAIELGTLPWARTELLGAILKCQRAHIDMVAGASETAPGFTSKASDVMTRLHHHIRDHRGAFVDLTKGLIQTAAHKHSACLGYINQQQGRLPEFLFSRDRLLKICGSNTELIRLTKRLRRDGILDEDANRPSVRRRLWADGRREQVIAVRADAFTDQ